MALKEVSRGPLLKIEGVNKQCSAGNVGIDVMWDIGIDNVPLAKPHYYSHIAFFQN